jgi:hypothetical protein
MPRYAEGTEVSPARSRAEIEHLLEQYGATGFAYGSQADQSMIAFEMHGRHIRMTLTYPSLKDFCYSASQNIVKWSQATSDDMSYQIRVITD